MREHRTRHGLLRTRWSAIGAAVAVTLGAGGLSMAQAAIDTGDRPVTISIAAERILDTRVDLGLSGRFADGAPRDLQVTGSVPTASGGSKTVVPANAVGVLVNVTVVTPTNDGFLSLRPQGATGDPTTSTVNFTPGSIEPNAATVDLNNGKIQIWVETSSDTGTADVLIDVVGYTVDHTHDDRYYTETEADAVHATKANSADVYTKAEADAVHTSKANASDVYTKAEIDAITVPRFGLIDSDGSIVIGSAGLVSSQRNSPGSYEMTFDRDMSQCAVNVTDFWFGNLTHLSADQTFGANTVNVYVVNSTGTPFDTRFNIIVQCPPPGAAPFVSGTATTRNTLPND